MTETSTYGIGNYNISHSCCSPIIYKNDFDKEYMMSDITERIERDKKFDERIKKMALNKKKMEEANNGKVRK